MKPSIKAIDMTLVTLVIWPQSVRVKKGRGQRKNKRDRAGRKAHTVTISAVLV